MNYIIDIPQNIRDLLKEVLDKGIRYPDKIKECKEHDIAEHCSYDRFIYNLNNGKCIHVRYNCNNVAIDIKSDQTEFPRFSSSTFYNSIDTLSKQLEKYDELVVDLLEIKEPSEELSFA